MAVNLRMIYKLDDPAQLQEDVIFGIDGASLGPWPVEYSREFTLRLLNSDLQRPIEHFAYARLRDKYPALLHERFARIALKKAAAAARRH